MKKKTELANIAWKEKTSASSDMLLMWKGWHIYIQMFQILAEDLHRF